MWLWPIGLLSCIYYIGIFYNTKLYAEMMLQLYYISVSVYGWVHWLKKIKTEEAKEIELPVTKIKSKQMGMYSIVLLFIYIALYGALQKFTDSPTPGWDAFVTAGSLVATWLLARKILENWLLWIFFDGIAIGIYIYKDLLITAILFVIYTTMAVIGYWNWRKDIIKVQV